jgi:hypothetical protein
MKIEHITYDEMHTRRSMARRASDASVKIKNYFRRLSRHSDAGLPFGNSKERPFTVWPQYGNETAVPDEHSEMTAYLTQHHRVEKAVRRDEKLAVSANSSGNYLPLKDICRGTETKDPPSPRLRRKAKFIKQNGKIKSTASHPPRPRTADDMIQMERFQRLRQAMKEGKLEQVIPPGQLLRPEGRHAPPPTRFADPTPRVSGESSRGRSSIRHGTTTHTRLSSRSRRTESSSRVREYLRTSVGFLDEKRKEVQGKFKAPFEHLNYPSFSFSQRASVSSEDSFFCVGENQEEQRSNTQAIHTLKSGHHETSNESRLSGVGVSPWARHAPDTCRLCNTFTTTSVRGLCHKCRAGFYLRMAQNNDPDSDYEDDLRFTPPLNDEDEIRPTPPLKDAKILSMRKQRDTQHYFQVETGSLEDVRATVALTDMGSRPIFNPVPVRRFSHEAVFMDADNEWERTQFQRTVEQWSTRYENDVAYVEKKDSTPLLRRKAKGLQQRDTEFYGFYDDVLDGR